MTELENRGILYRKRGVGSFVCHPEELAPALPETSSSPAGKLFAFVFPFHVSKTGLTDAFQAASDYLLSKGCYSSIYIADEHEDKTGRSILLIVNIWKGAGYNAVVYLATISGIDSSYYEAAKIDGATRWQQTWYISLPLLKPTVITLTLLSVGKIMNSDFGLFYNVTGDMPTLYATTDVIDTYIYRALRQMGDVGISSATGFFQSIVGFVLVLISNKLANMHESDAALF